MERVRLPVESTSIATFGPEHTELESAVFESQLPRVASVQSADGVIVTFGADPQVLARELETAPSVKWVQLPTAGIELFEESLKLRPDIVWTSAKGAYAEPVAEHALTLTLALLRNLPERVSAKSWGRASGTSLHGLNVVVVGAGGVALEIVRLVKMFRTTTTVVRRLEQNAAGADATIRLDDLRSVLPHADVIILAAALTESTRGMISTRELRLMKSSAIMVNIGRGALIDTDALVDALHQREIRGAALDVTSPEPLPDDHPLWNETSCLITPHTADTFEMIVPLYRERIRSNLACFSTGNQVDGIVDTVAGY